MKSRVIFLALIFVFSVEASDPRREGNHPNPGGHASGKGGHGEGATSEGARHATATASQMVQLGDFFRVGWDYAKAEGKGEKVDQVRLIPSAKGTEAELTLRGENDKIRVVKIPAPAHFPAVTSSIVAYVRTGREDANANAGAPRLFLNHILGEMQKLGEEKGPRAADLYKDQKLIRSIQLVVENNVVKALVDHVLGKHTITIDAATVKLFSDRYKFDVRDFAKGNPLLHLSDAKLVPTIVAKAQTVADANAKGSAAIAASSGEPTTVYLMVDRRDGVPTHDRAKSTAVAIAFDVTFADGKTKWKADEKDLEKIDKDKREVARIFALAMGEQ